MQMFAARTFGQQPLDIQMKPTKTTILLGEPLWVDVTVANLSKQALIIDFGSECFGAKPLKAEIATAIHVNEPPRTLRPKRDG
jgi:hypothetical protein